MHVMTNSGKLFAYELTQWSLESGFIQSQCQMSIYYKYAPDGKKYFFYIILMTVCNGIIMKLLKNGLWMIYGIDSM